MPDSFKNGNGNDNHFPYYPSAEREQTGSNGLDPKTIIPLMLRYKWIILLFLIAGLAGAWVYASVVTPAYLSRGTLMISTTNAFPDDERSMIISQATGYGTSSTLENELQILRSRKFSRQVANKLIEEDPGFAFDYPVLWVENEDGEFYRAGVDTVAAKIRENLNIVQPEEESDIVELRYKSPSPMEAAKIVNVALQIYVENSTQQNREAAQSTAQFLADEKQKTAKKLAISEEKLRGYMDSTGIVQVDQQASGLVAKRVDIESELQKITLDLKAVEENIANHEQRLERIKPGLSEHFSEAIGPRIRYSQEQLAQYENERMQIITKNPGVLDRKSEPGRLKDVDKQIERLKEEIRGLSDQLFTKGDEFMGLDSKDRAELVSNIQSQLIELRITKNQYEARRNALLKQKNEIDTRFNSLPEGMIELAKLQRDVRINEELYLNVSRQYADMSVWKESRYGFGRIIDPADVPSVPTDPNRLLLLLMGLMLGGFCSAGFITLREVRDNSIKSVDQLREHFPMLTFSAVPTFKKVSEKNRKTFVVGKGKIPDELAILHNSVSIAAEAIRRLKNNIIYQHGDVPPKTIAVTSPEKGDGKSTMVSNLGLAFAEEGYKTLIVGADFRRPKLHKYFGLSKETGLSDYLVGQLPFNELLMMIQDSELKTLKVLTAGTGTDKPEVIGSNKAFRHFLKKMEEVFDVIILDTPPFGIVSDSIALLKEVEAILVVVKHRKTNSKIFLRTIEELRRIKANLVGIVLNNFEHKKDSGYYYGSAYYKTLYDNYEAYSKQSD